MRKLNHFNKYISRIIIMSAAGCLLIFCTERYQTVFLSSTSFTGQTEGEIIAGQPLGNSVCFVSRTMDKWEDSLELIYQKAEALNMGKQREKSEIEYTPSVLQYNLVSLFPENQESDSETYANYADGGTAHSILNNPSELIDIFLKPLYQKLDLPVKNKVRDSYGGQMYDYLNRKDAEWTSDLYRWIQATPAKAAAMKSLSAASVMGTYNPNNPLHKAEDPSTWQVSTWKNVNINFYNGDGKQTELYSNTREILSMASVNTYYTGWQDIGHFMQYAGSLWDASHSYTTKISEVYYCEGCETPPASQINIAGETDPNKEVTGAVQGPASEISSSDILNTTNGASVASANGASVAGTGESGALPQNTSAYQGAVNDSALTASELPAASLVTPENGEGNGGGFTGDGVSPANPDEQAIAGQASDQSIQPAETVSASAVAPSAEESAETIVSETIASEIMSAGTAATSQSGAETAAVVSEAAVSAAGAPVSSGGSAGESTAALPVAAKVKLNASGKFCSGHVDLTITARITGLSEKKNLFTIDKAAAYPWTSYMKSYVFELNSKDWSYEYGLSPMELGIGTPLTSSEIGNYLNSLPIGTSPERKAVIAYALNSVGKIPYYYGGKPIASGYENNRFSTPTKPDQKGRVLSGLDCSGWINWVYWSALGKRLGALGTSGLISEGRAIDRSELKPGDILVKPGLNSHVVMFLGWASDNTMICIHETGGTISNVTVSTLGTNWPYYRAILD